MMRPLVAVCLGAVCLGLAAVGFGTLIGRSLQSDVAGPARAGSNAATPARNHDLNISASASDSKPHTPAASAVAASSPSGPATGRLPGAAALPSFDVVRVSPHGSAVIAGRAEPGSEVVVQDGPNEIGHARADSRGEWVVLPTTPLPPGGRELTVSGRDAAGIETRGSAPVILMVPERGGAPAGPGAMAVLVPPAGAPRILQAPAASSAPTPPSDLLPGQSPGSFAQSSVAPSPLSGTAPSARAFAPPAPQPTPAVLTTPPAATLATGPSPDVPAAPGLPAGRLGLDVIDYSDGGDIRFAGSAPPGSPVRVYVDNLPAGDTTADRQGRWSFAPPEGMPGGLHTLRIDQLTARGQVTARVETPFQRAIVPPGSVARGRVIVQPGHNLWRLARNAYGSGIRYTDIFSANREQIRDPNLIYPGQAFAVPQL